MFENSLFYLVFLSQIVLLSFYIPSRFVRRLDKIMTRFPAEEYPRLYPKGINFYQSRKRWFGTMNVAIFVLGFVVIYLIFLWSQVNSGRINPMFPWAYFMLQLLPVMLLEQSGFSQFKKMRETDDRSSRKADMTPRKLFDFISPTLFWSTIMAYVLMVLFVVVVHDFDFSLGGKPVLISLIVLAGNVFFAAIIAFNLYGKKLDPYQDNKDRLRKIEFSIKPLMYVSMAVSIYTAVTVGIDRYDLDFLEPITMSIYCQLITIVALSIQMNNIRIEDLNFEVYRKDAPTN